MIPNTDLIEISIDTIPSKDYRLNLQGDRIQGECDGIEVMKQVIFKILNTERYQNIIYSWSYGIETIDLYGRPVDYVISELERRIKEALLQDDRITEVSNFSFEKNGTKILALFTVKTIYGDTGAEKVVDI